MLELRNVTYRPGERAVVDDVDLTLPGGSITALLGPRGAGKTSLLRLLAGELTPTSGRIWLDGRELRGCPPVQHTPLRSVLSEQRCVGVRDRIARALQVAGATRLAVRPSSPSRSPDGAQLVLFEEPNDLDARHRYDLIFLFERLAEAGATVIAALRDFNHAALFADRAVLMQSGHVVADGLPEIVLNPTLIQRLYALPCALAKGIR